MKRRQEVVSRSSDSGGAGGGIVSWWWPQHRSYSCYCIVLSLLLQCGHLGADAGWIDLDTPFDKRTTQSLVDHTTYYLVMSDEFNVPNRTFADGHDPVWTALDRSDDDASSAGGGSMQFYNSSRVVTNNGYLEISTILEKTAWNRYDPVNKRWKHQQTNFSSGMVQSWNKFCFTGGIVEVDVIFPGDPFIGGLWPAVWMMGNLGRATYEASTNNLWPWSYDPPVSAAQPAAASAKTTSASGCNRPLQQAQAISSCNAANHFGMHPYQGRGATEIDLVEVMTGYSSEPLISTDPPISYPYADLTLQVAPGVTTNRPQSGGAPQRHKIVSPNGHTEFSAQTWYDGLRMEGNTSINPFFYGTYLAETKPGEPVTRSKEQAFQADAVGVAHQLTPSHFERPHTFRVEWQPGRGGRLDWFVKGYRYNDTMMMTGDGNGKEWVHAFSLKDKSLSDLMGSQIPIEPSYLIFNTAISSTWGFPYDAPEWCPRCYDCDDPKCACRFYPGFCEMIRTNKTIMYIDSVRVYQSLDGDAHVGANHTLGCDPPDYPTAEWIHGHSYRYMRNPPFVYADKHPLRPIQRGGGRCDTHRDCGSVERGQCYFASSSSSSSSSKNNNNNNNNNADASSSSSSSGLGTSPATTVTMTRRNIMMFSSLSSQQTDHVCVCAKGFTGPHCLAIDHIDDSPSAFQLKRQNATPFARIHGWQAPFFLMVCAGVMTVALLVAMRYQHRFGNHNNNLAHMKSSQEQQQRNRSSGGGGNANNGRRLLVQRGSV